MIFPAAKEPEHGMDFRRASACLFAAALFAEGAFPARGPEAAAEGGGPAAHGGHGVRRGEWSVLPVFGGGFVQGVAFAPSDPNVWYCWADVGGPYRSDDAGRSWRALHGAFALEDRAKCADQVRSLSVDPRDADTIVLASGDSFDKPGGIYVSRDGGRSFVPRMKARFYGNSRSRKMLGQCIARNPANPDELVAGEDWDGLFLSRDGGWSWMPVGPKEHWFTDIKYDLAVPGRVYACAPAVFPPPHARFSRRERKTGFFVSEDSGETWRRISGDAPAEIVQCPDSLEIVGSFGERPASLRISRDGGISWTDFGEGLPPDDLSRPWYFRGITALAATGGFWLAGSAEGDLYVRHHGQGAWSLVRRRAMSAGSAGEEAVVANVVARGMRLEALSSIALDPADDRHWIVADWYCIWESADAGETWSSRMNGISPLVSGTIAFDPFSPDAIHYGVADLGYFRSRDGGLTFLRPQGPVPYAASISFSDIAPGLAFAAGGKEHGSVMRTLDGGETWEALPAGNGLPDGRETKCGVFGVAVDPLAGDVYAAVGGVSGPGRGGVYRSCDSGDTWERFSEGLPEGVELFRNGEFGQGPGDAIFFSRDGSCLAATRKTGGLWRLDREAGRWIASGAPSTSGIVAADPFADGRFVLCGSPMLESADGGRTFSPMPGLPDGCRSVSFDRHVPGLAALGGRNGIFISRDGLRTARLLPGGMDFPSGGGDIRVFLDRGRLFVFSSGSGAWTLTIDLDSSDSQRQHIRTGDPR